MASVLLKNLAKLAGETSWRRGLALYQDGAVLDVHRNSRSVEARVANSRGTFERVRLTFGRQHLAARCTCRPQQRFCDHAVAALLQLAKEAPAQIEFLREADFQPAFTAAGWSEAEDTASPPSANPENPGRGKVSLQAFLRNSRPTAHLRLVVDTAVRALRSRWNHVRVEAELVFRERTYSAGNVKRLVETGHAAGGMRLADFPLQEQQILRFLCAEAEVRGTSFRLTAPGLADLFHCLSGFREVRSGEGRLQICPEHLQILFEQERDESGAVVRPRLLLPGRGVLPPERIQYIVGRNGYWIGLDRQYWWLPGVVPPNWLQVLLAGAQIRVSDEELGRLQADCRESRFPARLVPGEAAAELVARPGRCSPVLTLDWNPNGITAALSFDYHGEHVAWNGPLVLWGRNRFVCRNDDAEAAAAVRLQRLGFQVASDGPGTFQLTDPDALLAFLEPALAELESEWRLYWTPRFNSCRGASGDLNLRLKAGRETSAWFELECVLSGADGVRIDADDVSRACRERLGVLKLRDGRVLRFPPPLRDVLGLLWRRALTRHGNTLRFGRYAALPIADATAAYTDPGSASWLHIREQLEDRRGLPAPPIPARLGAILRPYQKDGVAWLAWLEECGYHGILADEMGLGKTVQALAVVAAHAAAPARTGPSLVVCPTSLVENWVLEARRFAPELRTRAVTGPERRQVLADHAAYELLVTSYALLRRDAATLRDCPFLYVILDEAQHIKNPLTANARACKDLQAEHRLILTGTPIENSLSEAWSLFDFLVPGFLGSRTQFRQEYEMPARNGDGATAAAELARQVRPLILRRTKDRVCQELPPKVEQVVYCELAPAQRSLYDALLTHGRELLVSARNGGWPQRRFEVLALLMRLRQVCCHPALLPADLRQEHDGDLHSAKTELLQEVVLEAIDSSHRMLLFSQFTSFLALLRPWLDENGIRYEYLDGNTRDRQDRVERFNDDPAIPLFLLSLRAGGTGLNLTGADTVIHYDQWWNPMVEDQATDRSHRIGQQRPVTALKLIARHTIEESILKLQAGKRGLFEALLSEAPTKVGELNIEDVEFLFGNGASLAD